MVGVVCKFFLAALKNSDSQCFATFTLSRSKGKHNPEGPHIQPLGNKDP